MAARIRAYEFTDTVFVVGSDPIVCVVAVSDLRRYLSITELNSAFSGFASYRSLPWLRRYVGVWGKKNCQRLRRFLRERGADVVIAYERPARLRLISYRTQEARRRVRSLRSN